MTLATGGRRARIAALAAITLCAAMAPGTAHAQRARISGPPRFDLTLGGGMVTGVSIGDVDANIRANAPALEDYRLFSASTELRPAPVLDLRLAGVVTGRLAIEGQLHFGKPELQTSITNDVESAPDVTVSERLTQLLAGGGVRVRLDNVRRPGRTMPYLSGGAAVLRQIHEDGTTVEQSPVVYVGGGVRHALGSGARGVPRAGIRADAQVLMVRGGLKLDDTFTPQLSVTGGVFFSF